MTKFQIKNNWVIKDGFILDISCPFSLLYFNHNKQNTLKEKKYGKQRKEWTGN